MPSRAKVVCLQGDPGSGKSMMAGKTAIKRPVHFVDVDRKILSAGWSQKYIDSKDITVWELSEPLDKSSLNSRVYSLVKKAKPPVQPKGWTMFGEYFNAHDDPNWVAAGTVVIDSYTLVNEHAKIHINYLADVGKFQFDQWNALKMLHIDTVSMLSDLHRHHNKDLILILHERDKSEPGDKTTGSKMERTVSASGDASYQEVWQGTKDYKVWASIDGAFGGLLGMQMDEYYYLYVDASDVDNPTWRCRVKPDGKRNLRTSFDLPNAVYAPDFREIWK